MSGEQWIAYWWRERYAHCYRQRSLWHEQYALADELLRLARERRRNEVCSEK